MSQFCSVSFKESVFSCKQGEHIILFKITNTAYADAKPQIC